MSARLEEKSLRYEGRFSSNKRLQAEGFAKDIEERIADRLGREVGALILEQDADATRRRNLFLAGLATHCDPPSLQKDFPAEFQVQKSYYFDGHSESEQRRSVWMDRRITVENYEEWTNYLYECLASIAKEDALGRLMRDTKGEVRQYLMSFPANSETRTCREQMIRDFVKQKPLIEMLLAGSPPT